MKRTVYICSGCRIGNAVDVERLKQMAQEEYGVEAEVRPFLCQKDSVAELNAVETDALVLAACSPRVNVENFTIPGKLVERVNIREMVAWTLPEGSEEAQELAEDYLRMGIAQVERRSLPEGIPQAVEDRLLVVGGGLSGLTAAVEAAEAGTKVTLVERAPELGGFARRFPKLFPRRSPYRDLEPNDIADLAARVQGHPNVDVRTSTEVVSTAGQPGSFSVTLRHEGAEEVLLAGALVVATGFRPYDANKLPHLGYGQHKDVVTSVEFEDMLAQGRAIRPSDGRPPRSVAFVQCAGSRDPNHLPYCSSFCCNGSLKQALLLREQQPDARAYILYTDMRTPGTGEEFYRRAQEDEGIFFARGEVPGVRAGAVGELLVELRDSTLGEALELQADLVVLAVGAVPTTHEDNVLNLQYRQGPLLPVDQYGFPDSNFNCFPFETQRTGIYSAGSVRQPMDLESCREDAAGAALKAIQSMRMAGGGGAVHPRSGDLSYPHFFLQKCTQCKRCTEECPFGALDDDEGGTPKLNPSRCRRCGICMGACPVQIISFENYSVASLSAAVKAVSMPEDPEKPRILAFVCENDAYPAFDMAGINRMQGEASVRVVPLRCLGSLNTILLADAFSGGVDGVLLAGCKSGADYQCHFIRGSELATRRMTNVRETLDRLMIESERVKFVQMAITDFDQVGEITRSFAEEIRAFGPNPFKGM